MALERPEGIAEGVEAFTDLAFEPVGSHGRMLRRRTVASPQEEAALALGLSVGISGVVLLGPAVSFFVVLGKSARFS